MLFIIAILVCIPFVINAISNIISDAKERKRANAKWTKLQNYENKITIKRNPEDDLT